MEQRNRKLWKKFGFPEIYLESLKDEKRKLLKMAEVSIWIDVYDDLFSDFDPRPYSQRALSDDFLREAKKASEDKSTGTIELRFLVPSEQRNFADEKLIKKRLYDHFQKHAAILGREISNQRKKGIILTSMGFALMILAAYIALNSLKDILQSIMLVFLEPSGWFITWVGLEQIVYTSGQKKSDFDFYKRMSKCKIIFTSY
jgi:hypothetical protein